MQGRGLRQALDRRGSVISTMPGDMRFLPGSRHGPDPRTSPACLHSAMPQRWPRIRPGGAQGAPADGNRPQRRPHSHGTRRQPEQRNLPEGHPLNVARHSPCARRRLISPKPRPQRDIRKIAKPLVHPRSFAPVFPVETRGIGLCPGTLQRHGTGRLVPDLFSFVKGIFELHNDISVVCNWAGCGRAAFRHSAAKSGHSAGGLGEWQLPTH